ncbi:MAG: hypothetical protein ACXWQO_05330 [Bdellovibrionota bacterium]
MLLLSLLMFTSSAQANTTLLDCNVEGGDQQVKVVQSLQGLELQELSGSGRWTSRALSQKEWNSQTLRLNGGSGETYLMYYDNNDKAWLYKNVGSSFRQFGTADCR